jgi:hypothetical protein
MTGPDANLAPVVNGGSVGFVKHSGGCCGFNQALIFVFLQGWYFHQCPFRISTVHCFAVVSQSLLCKSFRVAQRFFSFRPGDAVAMILIQIRSQKQNQTCLKLPGMV